MLRYLPMLYDFVVINSTINIIESLNLQLFIHFFPILTSISSLFISIFVYISLAMATFILIKFYIRGIRSMIDLFMLKFFHFLFNDLLSHMIIPLHMFLFVPVASLVHLKTSTYNMTFLFRLIFTTIGISFVSNFIISVTVCILFCMATATSKYHNYFMMPSHLQTTASIFVTSLSHCLFSAVTQFSSNYLLNPHPSSLPNASTIYQWRIDSIPR